MNTTSPIETAVAVQRAVFGLVPANMAEAMKLAEMMAGAKLVPAALQKSPADCLMVIQQAVRWQMDPFAVAQECSVIQGKLMHSGKLVAAVVNARGNLTDRLSFEYSGEGEERSIVVSGQLQGELEPRTVEVELKAAKTGNRVWTTQPDQQLMYHGCRVWARRHTPELMLGVWSPEEFEEPAPRRPAPPAPNIMRQLNNYDQETGELHGELDRPAVQEPAAPTPPIHPPGAAGVDYEHLEAMAREAASRGEDVFDVFFKGRSKAEKLHLKSMKDELVQLYPV